MLGCAVTLHSYGDVKASFAGYPGPKMATVLAWGSTPMRVAATECYRWSQAATRSSGCHSAAKADSCIADGDARTTITTTSFGAASLQPYYCCHFLEIPHCFTTG